MHHCTCARNEEEGKKRCSLKQECRFYMEGFEIFLQFGSWFFLNVSYTCVIFNWRENARLMSVCKSAHPGCSTAFFQMNPDLFGVKWLWIDTVSVNTLPPSLRVSGAYASYHIFILKAAPTVSHTHKHMHLSSLSPFGVFSSPGRLLPPKFPTVLPRLSACLRLVYVCLYFYLSVCLLCEVRPPGLF